MLLAVGAVLTLSSPLAASYRLRVTLGLPSTVSTLVGWYCSSLVSQGGSCCSRTITIGAYVFARRWVAEGGSALASPAAVRNAATAASPRNHLRERDFISKRPLRAARRPERFRRPQLCRRQRSRGQIRGSASPAAQSQNLRGPRSHFDHPDRV